ncbi:MAG: linear amide C-N hydrolase [Bacteroidales bacterium]|nr:linear amide C-N hydrolase [Bacteroidales bacterium]
MKKFLKILLLLVLVLLLAVTLLWQGEVRTLSTLKQVGDNPYLYTMVYCASYDLDDVIEKDVDTNAELLNYVISRVGKGLPIKIESSQVADEKGELKTFSCTSFQARKAEGEGYWYGRNYDYFKNPTLVTISHPKNGYASIGVSDMSHIGYGLDKLPTSFLKRINCMAAIYAPVDGINEKGLCTSIMALPHQASRQDTPRHDVGTSMIMRLWLDRCATVEEALALLETVDVRHDAIVGTGYHYMIADATGHCVVVEFDKDDEWKTVLVRKPVDQDYMLVTNHLLNPKHFTTEPDPSVGNPNSRSWWRYETAGAYLAAHKGILTLEQAQECLSQVHWVDLPLPSGEVEDTQYSNVYDQQNLTLSLRNWNDYGTTHTFSLK